MAPRKPYTARNSYNMQGGVADPWRTYPFPSVLIIDDNHKIGKLVVEIFNRLGFGRMWK